MKALDRTEYPIFDPPVPMNLTPSDYAEGVEPDEQDKAWHNQRAFLGRRALKMLEFCTDLHAISSEQVAEFCTEHDIEAITFDTPVSADVAVACTMLQRIELVARWINEISDLELWDAVPFVEEYLNKSLGTGEKIMEVDVLENIWEADGDDDIPQWPYDEADGEGG